MGATAENELMRLVLRGEMKRDALNRAENTRLGYAADWKDFTAWCLTQGCESLPATPQTVLLYSHAQLTSGRKVSTAIRRLLAINSYHNAAGHAAPATGDVWQFLLAVRRMRGEQPSQKAALSVDQLRVMCAMLPKTLHGLRDRAVLTVGFASALRRSTIVALDLADIEFRAEGLVLKIRREKQDRKAEGRVVGITRGNHADTCPARSLEAWIRERGAAPGPLFTPVYYNFAQNRRLTPAHIARIVKQAAQRIGLDPKDWAAHSMRAGFVTSCINSGLPDLMVMAHTAHRDLGTLRIYHRRASDPFVGNPSALIGL